MLSGIRKRLSYANVTATLALFFAMSGGALAASHYLITSTKQIKPSVLTALKGKTGPAGAAGAAGSQGPQGPQGAAGVGSPGANGESVTATELKAGSACKEGGTEFKVGSTATRACNGTRGAAGVKGEEGSPWTDGGTLPAAKTETGTWDYRNQATTEGAVYVSLSFPIPLKEPMDKSVNEEEEESTQVHVVWKGETDPAGCKGGSVSNPLAEPGNVCVYGAVENQYSGLAGMLTANDFENLKAGAGRTGTILLGTAKPSAEAYGVWAVTAPEEA